MNDIEIIVKKWGLTKLQARPQYADYRDWRDVHVEWDEDPGSGCPTCGYEGYQFARIRYGATSIEEADLDFGEVIREMTAIEVTDFDRAQARKMGMVV